MQKVSRQVFKILTNSFLISAVSLLISFLIYLIKEDSVIGSTFGTIGWYGLWITVFIFNVHLLIVMLNFLFDNENYNN